MKRIYTIALMIAGLILIPLRGFPSSDGPPVAQPLVREGDFAIELVKALNLGTPQDEADAENILISNDIAPQNGWISDYPVTPDILGDLQNAINDAADAGRLPIQKDEALKSLETVAEDFGLGVSVDTTGGASRDNGPPESSSQENAEVINSYYDDNGPPVISYYPPPPEYYYLYAWVPYPFWSDGYFFTGYFCLHDFDRIIVIHSARRVCTNHFIDQRTRGVVFINPATRGIQRHFRNESGFTSRQVQRGEAAIFHRHVEQGGNTQSEHRDFTGQFSSGHPVPSTGPKKYPPRSPYHKDGGMSQTSGSRPDAGDNDNDGDRGYNPAPNGAGRGHFTQFHNNMTGNVDHDGAYRNRSDNDGPGRDESFGNFHDNNGANSNGYSGGWHGGSSGGFRGGGYRYRR